MATTTDDLDRIFRRCESLDETPSPFRGVRGNERHDQRQPIPVVKSVDEATRIIDALDAVFALGVYADFTIFAEKHAEGLAEHVFRLWASAQKLDVEDRTATYEDGSTIRSLQLRGYNGHISVLWPRVAADAPEVREPVPGVVIPLPPPFVEPGVTEAWRPSDDAEVRFGLLEME